MIAIIFSKTKEDCCKKFDLLLKNLLFRNYLQQSFSRTKSDLKIFQQKDPML